jgi:plastocyanin
MVDRGPTRRRLLGVLAAGIGIGVAGCTGTDSANERDGSTRSTATRLAGVDTPATSTASPTTATTATSDRSTATSTRRSTNSDGSPATTADPASGTPPTTGDAAQQGAYTVGMHTDLYFDPIGLFVEPGTTVSFELVSGVHSATAYHPDNEYARNRRVPRGAPSWTTGQFSEEGAFENVTFETRGTHDYYCIPHKQLGMIGRIVVGEPGGPATRSANPDGGLPDSERIVEQGTISYEAFRANGE